MEIYNSSSYSCIQDYAKKKFREIKLDVLKIRQSQITQPKLFSD